MKIKALIATTNVNKNRETFTFQAFTLQALEDLSNIQGFPILFNFDPSKPVGKVLDTYIDDEKLYIIGEFDDATFFNPERYCVPGFTILDECYYNFVNRIKFVRPISIGYVLPPPDTSLTPIEEYNE